MNKVVKDIEYLRNISESVESAQEASDIISKLTTAIKDMKDAVGLAAIQIGIPKTVGIIVQSNGDIFSLINPYDLNGTNEFTFLDEGCLSIPGKYFDTKRYQDFSIKNHVIVDGELEEEVQEYHYSNENDPDRLFPIAIQHEMDHFNGKLVIDFKLKGSTVVRDTEKIGRNDPCLCGSGKKHKKCCLK